MSLPFLRGLAPSPGLGRRAVGLLQVHLVEGRVEDGEHEPCVAGAERLERNARERVGLRVVREAAEQAHDRRAQPVAAAQPASAGTEQLERRGLVVGGEVHRVVGVKVRYHDAPAS